MGIKLINSATCVCLVVFSFSANALSVSQTQMITMQGSESWSNALGSYLDTDYSNTVYFQGFDGSLGTLTGAYIDINWSIDSTFTAHASSLNTPQTVDTPAETLVKGTHIIDATVAINGTDYSTQSSNHRYVGCTSNPSAASFRTECQRTDLRPFTSDLTFSLDPLIGDLYKSELTLGQFTYDLTQSFSLDFIECLGALNPTCSATLDTLGWKANATLTFDYEEAPVSAVPLPAAIWLFGAGLIGLIGVARRKKI